MKKFFYVAIMALTTLFAVSCVSMSGAKEPKIDEEKHSVNGVVYDNETYCCWEFTWEYTITGTGLAAGAEAEHDSGVDYYWWTEFDAQSYKANWDYAHNQKVTSTFGGAKSKGTSSLKKLDKTESECYDMD